MKKLLLILLVTQTGLQAKTVNQKKQMINQVTTTEKAVDDYIDHLIEEEQNKKIPENVIDSYNSILADLELLDKKLISISFWAQFRLFEYFKQRYSTDKIKALQDDINAVE